MNNWKVLVAVLALTCAGLAQSLRISNVLIIDGSGGKPFKGEVRIEGDKIVAVGAKVALQKNESVRDGRGMVLAPGFIDMHSHADDGIFTTPADNVVRQGITTVLVGQDGDSQFPLKDFFTKLEQHPTAMNVASMAGHATLRIQVMGEPAAMSRASTLQELDKMFTMLHYEMQAGAMGLSSGLEYDAGQFATTEELIQLSKMAAGHGGFYISHVRDEGNKVFDSYDEILKIGRAAKIPVEITHIKLGTTPVWHLAASRMPEIFARAQRDGVDLKADVYPYTYWQSNLRVIVQDRDYFNAAKVEKAITDNGGASHIRITHFVPDKQIEDKTLEQIAAGWKITPVEAFMRIVKITESAKPGEDAEAEVLGESMHPDDMNWFAVDPHVMFCTDGQLNGAHPRGAGSFPRILGRMVREEKLMPLEVAIQKASAMPAQQLRLNDRGKIQVGYKADLVLFDPETVIDRATVAAPHEAPTGIDSVMVNGKWVVDEGKLTSARPGVVLRKPTLEQQHAAAAQK